MIKTITCAAVVSGMTASAAYAASFDCNHAPLSNTEHIICDDVRISKKDDQLHKEYTALLAALPANDKAAFKQEQHQWITTRDRCTGGYEYTVGCLHEAYDQRLYEFGLRSKKLEVQAEVEAETRAAAAMNTVDVQPMPEHEVPKPVVSIPVSTESLNCRAKQENPVDQIICDDPALLSLDEELTTIYKHMSALSSENQQDFVKQHQRQWFVERQGCTSSSNITVCLKNQYSIKIPVVKALDERIERDHLLVDQQVLHEVKDWVYVLVLSVSRPADQPSNDTYIAYGETPKQCADALSEAEKYEMAEKAYKRTGFPAELSCKELSVDHLSLNSVKKLMSATYIKR